MVTHSAGIITVANGHRRYLSLATDLALSVRKHTSLPISLLVDPAWGDFRQTRYAQYFDQIIDLPTDALPCNFAKLHTADLTPYELTLYFDADVILTSHVGRAFAAILADQTGYVLNGGYHPPSDHLEHNGIKISAICEKFGLPRYFKSNAGVMGFRKHPGVAIQAAARAQQKTCPKLFEKIPQLKYDDEIYFGIIADRFNLGSFGSAKPLHWLMQDIEREGLNGKGVHAIGWSHYSYNWLMNELVALRRSAKLPLFVAQWNWSRKLFPRNNYLEILWRIALIHIWRNLALPLDLQRRFWR